MSHKLRPIMTEPMHAARRRTPSALRVLTAVAILASILTLTTPGAATALMPAQQRVAKHLVT